MQERDDKNLENHKHVDDPSSVDNVNEDRHLKLAPASRRGRRLFLTYRNPGRRNRAYFCLSRNPRYVPFFGVLISRTSSRISDN